ncbi:MAG TPA: ABC transporter permease subunit [Bdellovibrionota bacterium]|nr:ABC transporter permease subunit [Bdellovibrionota bacterium]
MGHFTAIYIKELKSFFTSPMAYVILGIFSFITGIYFFFLVNDYQQELIQYYRNLQMFGQLPQFQEQLEKFSVTNRILRPTFSWIGILLIFFVPVLSGKLIAEERKNKTMELLMTSPVSLFEIVLGKYVAVLTFFIVMLFVSLVFPALILKYGSPDMGPIVTEYLGLFLLGASYLAWGLCASTLTNNPIIASVVTFFSLLMTWFIGIISNFINEPWSKFAYYAALPPHWLETSAGLIDTRNLVYFLSFIIFCLFLSHRSLRSQSWRGS